MKKTKKRDIFENLENDDSAIFKNQYSKIKFPNQKKNINLRKQVERLQIKPPISTKQRGQVQFQQNEEEEFKNDQGNGFFGDVGNFFSSVGDKVSNVAQDTVGDVTNQVIDPMISGTKNQIINPITQGVGFAKSTIIGESEYSNSQNETGYGWSTVRVGRMDRHNWMEQLDDNLKLNQLFIPGTHDSGSHKTILQASLGQTTNLLTNIVSSSFGNLTSEATTQSMDIQNQLQTGIRAFDFRLGPGLNLYHGAINMNQDFQQVFQELIAFVRQNNKEFIFLRIKQDTQMSYSDCINFQNMVREYSQYFVNAQSTNSVYSVRGKLIFYDIGNIQVNYINALVFYDKSYCYDIQDDYNVPYQKKIDILTNNLFNNRTNDSKINVNYVSAYSSDDWPFTMAQKVNAGLMDLFVQNYHLNSSILMMDFPSDQLINLIIKRNWSNDKQFIITNSQGIDLCQQDILSKIIKPVIATQPPPSPFYPQFSQTLFSQVLQQLANYKYWHISDMNNGNYVMYNVLTKNFINFSKYTIQSSCNDFDCYIQILPLNQQQDPFEEQFGSIIIKNQKQQTYIYENDQLCFSTTDDHQSFNISIWNYKKF